MTTSQDERHRPSHRKNPGRTELGLMLVVVLGLLVAVVSMAALSS